MTPGNLGVVERDVCRAVSADDHSVRNANARRGTVLRHHLKEQTLGVGLCFGHSSARNASHRIDSTTRALHPNVEQPAPVVIVFELRRGIYREEWTDAKSVVIGQASRRLSVCSKRGQEEVSDPDPAPEPGVERSIGRADSIEGAVPVGEIPVEATRRGHRQ